MIDKTYPILEKLIINALQLLEQLQQHLIHEEEVLQKSRNAELITTIASNKKRLVMQLELFNTHCGQLLATEKLANNQTGILEYFQRAASAGLLTAELSKNWEHVQSLCATCKTLNDKNGASIALLSLHTNRSLDILKGKPHTANTYSPNGSTQNEHYTRPLISV